MYEVRNQIKYSRVLSIINVSIEIVFPLFLIIQSFLSKKDENKELEDELFNKRNFNIFTLIIQLIWHLSNQIITTNFKFRQFNESIIGWILYWIILIIIQQIIFPLICQDSIHERNYNIVKDNSKDLQVVFNIPSRFEYVDFKLSQNILNDVFSINNSSSNKYHPKESTIIRKHKTKQSIIINSISKIFSVKKKQDNMDINTIPPQKINELIQNFKKDKELFDQFKMLVDQNKDQNQILKSIKIFRPEIQVKFIEYNIDISKIDNDDQIKTESNNTKNKNNFKEFEQKIESMIESNYLDYIQMINNNMKNFNINDPLLEKLYQDIYNQIKTCQQLEIDVRKDLLQFQIKIKLIQSITIEKELINDISQNLKNVNELVTQDVLTFNLSQSKLIQQAKKQNYQIKIQIDSEIIKKLNEKHKCQSNNSDNLLFFENYSNVVQLSKINQNVFKINDNESLFSSIDKTALCLLYLNESVNYTNLQKQNIIRSINAAHDNKFLNYMRYDLLSNFPINVFTQLEDSQIDSINFQYGERFGFQFLQLNTLSENLFYLAIFGVFIYFLNMAQYLFILQEVKALPLPQFILSLRVINFNHSENHVYILTAILQLIQIFQTNLTLQYFSNQQEKIEQLKSQEWINQEIEKKESAKVTKFSNVISINNFILCMTSILTSIFIWNYLYAMRIQENDQIPKFQGLFIFNIVLKVLKSIIKVIMKEVALFLNNFNPTNSEDKKWNDEIKIIQFSEWLNGVMAWIYIAFLKERLAEECIENKIYEDKDITLRVTDCLYEIESNYILGTFIDICLLNLIESLLTRLTQDLILDINVDDFLQPTTFISNLLFHDNFYISYDESSNF